MKTNVTEHDVLIRKYIEKQKREEDVKAIRTVLKSKAGRWFFIHILEMTGFKAETFTGNSQTFYNEGRRSIGIQIEKEMVELLGKEGFELRQKAEKEYIEFQFKAKALLENKEE